MLLGTYYLILALIGLLCWDLTYASTEHRAVRIFWRALGIVIVTLPIFLPLKTAFYYGLLYNSTVFSWSADTWTHGTDPRRGRSILAQVFWPLFRCSGIGPSKSGWELFLFRLWAYSSWVA